MRCLPLLLAFLLQGVSPAAPAQAPASVPLSTHLSVLNGRAFFDFPAEAKNTPRQVDIMSADRNANLETRIIYDSQDMRLVFFARELFAVGDKNHLTQAVTAESTTSHARVQTVVDNAGAFALLATPTAFDEKAEAVLVNQLLVRTADNTVFQIQAFVNPAANKQRVAFMALTERVFRSLQAGPRSNNRQAHAEVLGLMGSAQTLTVPLPADFAVTVDQKYDFQVFHFHHYHPYGGQEQRTLLLYVGRHPSSLYPNFGFQPEQATKVAGQVLGQPMQWLVFADAQKGVYVKEQQVSGAGIAPGLRLHIGMVSDQPAALEEMTQLIAGITLTP